MYWDPKVDDPQDISITVSGSTATLSGKVESAAVRHSAEINALLVPGIKAVDNRLTVVPPGSTTDDGIAAAVRNALTKNSLLTTGIITVGAANGEVTLTGTVTSRDAFKAAEKIVQSTKGVTKINNELVILAP